MQPRQCLAVVMLAVCGVPFTMAAQNRTTVGAQTSPPMRPAPPSRVSQPTIPAPRGGGATMVPILGGPFPRAPEHHRPIRFRSSLFGLVVFDPYWWLAPSFDDGTAVPPSMLQAGPELSGGLQLDVEPRRALVYVDGVLVGTVDQFSGYFQHLNTSAGYHVLAFFSPDYEPLVAGVTVVPHTTTTYRASLNRASGR